MLRQLKRTVSSRAFQTLVQFVEKQPAGYCEGLKATGDKAFAEAIADVLRSYLSLWAIERQLDLGNPALDLSGLLPIYDDKVLAECPVYPVNDLEEVGAAPGSVWLIQCITDIIETEKFERQLQRQEPTIQKDWSRKKEQIKICLPSPPRFEQLKGWEPPTWSLRLRDGHRVHLQPPQSDTLTWRAVAIGNHREMGHG